MKLVLSVLFCSLVLTLWARSGYRVVFYNTENFFDCWHDSLKSDEEFLPGGIRGWTPSRYYRKAGAIARVLAAIGEDKFPEIVGLAEVENEACLKTLVYSSPLKNAGYRFVHEESEDARGVDVGLLYNRYLFELMGHQVLKVIFDNEPSKKTRDVLHVWGKVATGKPLHLFVCHFPSRLGGETESEPYRRQVARMIRSKIDSVFTQEPSANIVIMGDFNDFPSNSSLSKDLNAKYPQKSPEGGTLYNLMLPLENVPGIGTNKHLSEWGILDQMIVSTNLLAKTSEAHIFGPDFLLLEDDRWLGKKPFRTYNGMVYQGGYSDHLPVWIDLSF
ncbi:MAG TPA: endonuclease/exonuclease/phosphatase family protein [Bacteroidales bacterium]|nr:endonuclease/exonuclease/phosphatase family protein [Bacteroidales bacterium]